MIDYDELQEFVVINLGEIASQKEYMPEDRLRALELLGIISGIIMPEETE